jgi:tRNA G18 (ribose-2'-O)-methylase SpoU
MKRLILDNIRSVHNVGSIFRTADAAGVSKIYLAGVTPAPIDRFGRARKDFAKVSLGAEKSVPWEQVKNVSEVIEELKKEAVKVVAVEQSSNSVSLYDFKPAEKVAYVLGSETEGLSADVLEVCDEIVEIPMKGEKESLNVSVTAGIILFHHHS